MVKTGYFVYSASMNTSNTLYVVLYVMNSILIIQDLLMFYVSDALVFCIVIACVLLVNNETWLSIQEISMSYTNYVHVSCKVITCVLLVNNAMWLSIQALHMLSYIIFVSVLCKAIACVMIILLIILNRRDCINALWVLV